MKPANVLLTEDGLAKLADVVRPSFEYFLIQIVMLEKGG